jgi:hypothetical protein
MIYAAAIAFSALLGAYAHDPLPGTIVGVQSRCQG